VSIGIIADNVLGPLKVQSQFTSASYLHFLQDEVSLLFENSDVPTCKQMWIFWLDLFHTSQLMSRPFE
jgi:hypothetical protein